MSVIRWSIRLLLFLALIYGQSLNVCAGKTIVAMVPLIFAISLLTSKSIYWVKFLSATQATLMHDSRKLSPQPVGLFIICYVKHAHVMFCLFFFVLCSRACN